MLGQIIILAAVGLVDRIGPLFFGGDFVTPRADFLRNLGGLRGTERTLSGGMTFIGLHAATGGVDDDHAAIAGILQHLVHARSKLTAATSRIEAVVQVPHVANDDSRSAGIP